MEEVTLAALLNPVLAEVIAVAFFALWTKQKTKMHILAMSFAYAISGVSFVLSHFVLGRASVLSVVVASGLYMAGITALVWAIGHRADKKPSFLLMSVVGIGGTALAAYLTSIYPTMNTRSLVINTTIGLLFATGVWSLRGSLKKSSLDRLLFWVLVAITGQFLLLPSLLLINGAHLTSSAYRDSVYWLILNFSLAVSSLVLALSLLALCAADLLQQVRELANIDKLTGLKNRRAFEESVDEMFTRLDRTPVPASVVVADLDHFKRVNDEYGHQAGDKVLEAFGHLLQSSVRESDLVGRMGGEEFCIVLWNTNADNARLFTEGLRASFEALYVSACHASRDVTASFGVVARLHNESFSHLYGKADKALYEAKLTGRNRVVMVDHKPASVTQLNAA